MKSKYDLRVLLSENKQLKEENAQLKERAQEAEGKLWKAEKLIATLESNLEE